MNTREHHTRLALAAVAALSLVAVSCGSDDEAADTTAAAVETTAAVETSAAADTTVAAETTVADTAAPSFEGDLVGTFEITTGACDGTAVSGSYFQMVQPGGTPTDGPFIPNADSSCADPNYSLLAPGTDGGLITGTFQPAPDPACDATGNGLAASIIAPVTFFAVAFAAATDDTSATPPSVSATDGTLTADLSAFTAYYGAGVFNQGAPKPDGSGDAPTGTIDPTTGAYVLEWTSLIQGGSFDGFTGVWHLEGTFTPAG